MGLPSGSSDNSPANARDVKNTGLIPGFETIPWGREWQPTPVFLLENPRGQRSLAGYS